MRKASLSNLAASVRQRLLNISKDVGDPFDLVLTRYASERFLYRLGNSQYADQFILKGAMLFLIWGEGKHRPTRDLDFLGFGNHSDDQLIDLFKNICLVEVEPDGLMFDTTNIRITDTREQEEYDGRRVQFAAYLAEARISIQVDIGFGDVITPTASLIVYPTLLEFPAPQIKAYPRESVVSEKLQAMIALGMPNSRMKDFYDIWILTRQFDFEGKTLAEAIVATFDRRLTDIPSELPTALSDEFVLDKEKIKQWEAFIRRTGLPENDLDFSKVINDLKQFLLPPLLALSHNKQFDKNWIAGKHWL